MERASVRAIRTNSPPSRADAAALILDRKSSAGTMALLSKWPHFFGKTWSSICMAETPARSYSRTARAALSSFPNPVSPSAMSGIDRVRAMRDATATISVMVSTPKSGNPWDAATPAPVI